MEIISITGKQSTTAGTSVYAAEAEVKRDDGTEVFVNAGEYTGMRTYTLTDKSVIGYLTDGVEDPNAIILESYGDLNETNDSAYAAAFKVLDGMVTLMVSGI